MIVKMFYHPVNFFFILSTNNTQNSWVMQHELGTLYTVIPEWFVGISSLSFNGPITAICKYYVYNGKNFTGKWGFIH